MVLWIIFAGMTAVVLAALFWPLYRRRTPEAGPRSPEIAVYRDQLAEIERDSARGLIGPEEAQAARNEVSRRMLAAAESRDGDADRAPAGAARTVHVSALIAIPAVAVSIYLVLGQPNLAGLPRAERLATAVERSDLPAMVAQVEAHLAENPQDPQGWIVLAPAYRGMNRHADAAAAYARALDLVPPTARLLTEYGESLVLANDGVVPAEAREAFEQALALDGSAAKARFYRALADRQEGKLEAARHAWRTMLAEAPADAAWRPAVERQLASLPAGLQDDTGSAPKLSQDDIAAADSLDDGDREAAIRDMVDGLARRLAEDGGDLQGWLRLARARVVLGESDAATAALRSAEQRFSDDAASLAQIDAARQALGLGDED